MIKNHENSLLKRIKAVRSRRKWILIFKLLSCTPTHTIISSPGNPLNPQLPLHKYGVFFSSFFCSWPTEKATRERARYIRQRACLLAFISLEQHILARFHPVPRLIASAVYPDGSSQGKTHARTSTIIGYKLYSLIFSNY